MADNQSQPAPNQPQSNPLEKFAFTSKTFGMIGASVVLFLLLLLPWVTVGDASANAFAAYGSSYDILFLILSLGGIAAAMASVFKNFTEQNRTYAMYGYVGATGAYAFFAFLDLLDRLGNSIFDPGFGLIIALFLSAGVSGYFGYLAYQDHSKKSRK